MSAWTLLAGLMLGMAAPHPLVVAAERLHEQGLDAACDALVAHALAEPELTDADRASLQRLAKGPAAPGPVLVRRAVRVRDPRLRSLLGAMDALFQLGQFAGAKEVLAVAQALEPSSQSDLVQLLLRQGLMAMPAEAESRLIFRDVLAMDRDARLPDYAESKAKAVLEAVRRTLPPPVRPTPAQPPPPQWNLGILTGAGGLTLLASGAAASLVTALALRNEELSRDAGNQAAYLRAQNTALTAKWTAGGLLGVGAVALGVGAALCLKPQAGIRIGASAGPGQAGVTLWGSF